MGGLGSFHRGWVGAAALLAGAAVATGAWAQAQPKLPVPPPAPRTGGGTPARPPASPRAPAQAPAAPGAPRDPFEPLVRRADPAEERRVQEVASLKLVGVIWDAKAPEAIRALVETPDGLGYYLRVNDEKFGGKVVAVERSLVRFLIREEVPGAGTRERTVELKLPKPGGQP